MKKVADYYQLHFVQCIILLQVICICNHYTFSLELVYITCCIFFLYSFYDCSIRISFIKSNNLISFLFFQSHIKPSQKNNNRSNYTAYSTKNNTCNHLVTFHFCYFLSANFSYILTSSTTHSLSRSYTSLIVSFSCSTFTCNFFIISSTSCTSHN